MMQIDIDNIPYDDAKTWELIQSGLTCGVFQCESQLVQHWLKTIKPRNLWELSAVIALVRPGPLKSGYIEEYVKNKLVSEAEWESIGNKVADSIAKKTNNVYIYQEQLMLLGDKLAWSHMPEDDRLIKVDNLRKAVGKKDQNKILAVGKEFVDGCSHNHINPDVAHKIFELIKNSGRYAFNLSHSMTYAYVAYKTAYLKAHAPLEFYTVYLSYAHEKLDKWEEIEKLVNECRIFSINIVSPNINKKNANFLIDGDDTIRFGLSHIKYGPSRQLMTTIENLPEIKLWQHFIIFGFTKMFGDCPRSTTMESLIKCGAFQNIKLSRKKLLGIYHLFSELSSKELEYAVSNIENYTVEQIPSLIRDIINNKCMKKRQPLLESHLQVYLEADHYDHPVWVANEEKLLMGVRLSANEIDAKNCDQSDTCCDCSADWPIRTKKTVNVVIDEVIHTTTKKGSNPGQKMARIRVRDGSGQLSNIPVFPDDFMVFGDLLMVNNTVTLNLEMGKTGWICKGMTQL
jgi:DNA polymerase III alpha subunit